MNKLQYYAKSTRLRFNAFIDGHALLLLSVILTILSVTARELAALTPTNDVVGYVFKWLDEIQQVGFTNFYKVDSDYSPLYLFFLALFSLLPAGKEVSIAGFTFFANRMYYLKSMFFLCDIGIAIGLALLVFEVTKDKTCAFISYMVATCLPVQFFNSAVWGNCDSMYFLCFVYILYALLKHNDFVAYLLVGVAFGLKLQSVFILPLLVFLSFSGRIKFYPVFMTVVGFALTLVPALLCGASLPECVSYIGKELGGYSKLTLGCANLWQLIDVNASALDVFNQAAPIIGLMLIGLFMAIVYIRKIDLSDNGNLLCVATFLIAIVPFFLPHMHERYFYALDCLVVVYAFIRKKHYHLIALMQISSGIAYFHYLAGYYFIESWGEGSVHIAAFINIYVLYTIFMELLKLEHSDLKRSKHDHEAELKALNEQFKK